MICISYEIFFELDESKFEVDESNFELDESDFGLDGIILHYMKERFELYECDFELGKT